MSFIYLFSDVVLHQAVQGHDAADLQQDGRRAGGLTARLPTQVTGRRAAALLLTADLHAGHQVIRQQLRLQQTRQVTDEGHGFQVASAALLCDLCEGERETSLLQMCASDQNKQMMRRTN